MAAITNIHPDFSQFMRDNTNMNPSFHYMTDKQFYGASSKTECLAYIARGASAAEQAPAVKLLEKIDASTHGRKKVQAMPSVAGERVNMGAYLRGEPQNMRRRVRVEHERSPIRVCLELIVSAGVSHDQLARRGAAIAALAVRLAEVRPVELWVSWGNMASSHTSVCGRVRLDTTPLSMANAVAVMASPMFCRGILFGEMWRQGKATSENSLPWAFGYPSDADRTRKLRAALQLEPQDIFIPGGHLTEAAQFMADPVAWVNSYLDSQREAE